MPHNDPQDQFSPKPSFEEAMQRLEEIVGQLEAGQLGLEQALARYEEGVKLLRRCYELLQHAERRIELLTGVDATGKPLTTPLDAAAALPAEELDRPAAPNRSAAALDQEERPDEPDDLPAEREHR